MCWSMSPAFWRLTRNMGLRSTPRDSLESAREAFEMWLRSAGGANVKAAEEWRHYGEVTLLRNTRATVNQSLWSGSWRSTSSQCLSYEEYDHMVSFDKASPINKSKYAGITASQWQLTRGGSVEMLVHRVCLDLRTLISQFDRRFIWIKFHVSRMCFNLLD